MPLQRRSHKGLCADLPIVELCNVLPTPLEPADRLSQAAGDVHILVKREDLTGLALGGNKIRNLEFIFGDIQAHGCNAVVTTAGVQSNMCRATAAAASRAGMPCVLLLRGTGNEKTQGNLLLDHLLGADVRFIPTQDPYDERVPGWLDQAKRQLKADGLQPYILHLTGATGGLATCAYVAAAEELAQQFDDLHIAPQWLYATLGAGITAAGLALGFKHLKLSTRVVGVSANSPAAFLAGRIAQYAHEAAEILGMETRLDDSDFDVTDAYVGPGYGQPYPAALTTIRSFAKNEALLLDPVYTGKCATALLDHIQTGKIPAGESAIFLHSGGAPNLFAQAEVMSS